MKLDILFLGIVVGRLKRGKMGYDKKRKFFINNSLGAAILFK